MGWLTNYQIAQHRDQAQRNRLQGKSGAGDDFIANLLERGERDARDRRASEETEHQTRQLQNQIRELEQSREIARRERQERREERRERKREQRVFNALLDDLWDHLRGIEVECEELSLKAFAEGSDRLIIGEWIYRQCLAYAAWRDKKNAAYARRDLYVEGQQRIADILTATTRKLHLPDFFRLTCIAQDLQNAANRAIYILGLLESRAAIPSKNEKDEFQALHERMDNIAKSPSLRWKNIVADLRELPFILDQLNELKEKFSMVVKHTEEAAEAGLLSNDVPKTVKSPYDAVFETLPNQSMDIPSLNKIIAEAMQADWLESTIARIQVAWNRAIRLCKTELNVQHDAIMACDNYWPAASAAIEGREAFVPWEDGMGSLSENFPSY